MATYSLPTGHINLEARLVWTYSQDFNNNTSTIYAHVEARRISSYMSTVDLSNPNMEIIIDGEYFNSNGSYNFGAHPVWEWFTIGSEAVKTVWHNNDGTRSLNISTWHNTSITNFGNIWKTQSITLDTIPRASTISSGTDWVVGHNSDIYINRKSTDYYHSLFIDIGYDGVWQNFATRYGVGGSISTNFTEIEQAAMMDFFNARPTLWEVQSRIRMETYNAGGSQVGSTTYINGTIWRPSESAIYSLSSLEMALVGVPYSLSGVNGSQWITHSLKLYSGTFNKTITLLNGESVNGNIVLTQANMDTIYGLYSNQTYAPFNIELTTFIAGRQLGSKRTISTGDGKLTFNTVAITPTFIGVPTYADTNTAVTAITTNNQHIVQNKSNLKITIPANSSTPKYGATLTTYSVNVNGVEKTATYSTEAVVIDFGLVNVNTNTTAQISVIDSRGIRASKSITVTVLPYSNPTISGTAIRASGFESLTNVSVVGNLSTVNAKNTITLIRYRFKLTTSGTWGNYVSLTPILGSGTYSTTATQVTLDNSLTYDIEFNVTDTFGTVISSFVFVDTGKPIMFVDKAHKSVGIGKFPTRDNSFETAGDGFFDGSLNVAGTEGNVYHTENKPTPLELGAEGAIVYGSNANGSYMKFADGTMICTGTQSLSSNVTSVSDGGMFYDPTQRTITYPVSFYDVPDVIASGIDCMVVPLTPTTTTTGFWVYRAWSGISTIGVTWYAEGRWKA